MRGICFQGDQGRCYTRSTRAGWDGEGLPRNDAHQSSTEGQGGAPGCSDKDDVTPGGVEQDSFAGGPGLEV